MSRTRRTIVDAVTACILVLAGSNVCSAQSGWFAVYADMAWSDGVMYSTGSGYDYTDPPYYHWGQQLQTTVYTPTRTAYETSAIALDFNDDFGTWTTTAAYSFYCSSGYYFWGDTGVTIDMSYPAQHGAVNPASLAACLSACAQGTNAIQAFCRALVAPPPVKAACWAVQFAGPVACSGFCYWYFS